MTKEPNVGPLDGKMMWLGLVGWSYGPCRRFLWIQGWDQMIHFMDLSHSYWCSTNVEDKCGYSSSANAIGLPGEIPENSWVSFCDSWELGLGVSQAGCMQPDAVSTLSSAPSIRNKIQLCKCMKHVAAFIFYEFLWDYSFPADKTGQD